MIDTDPTGTSEAEREVLAAEDRRYQAMRDGDVATLDELLADELSYTHSSGSRDTKAQFLAKVGSGHFVYLRIDHPVERVEVYGDTALVIGRMGADLEVQGRPRTLDNFALAVWTRTSGTWRLVAYAPTPRSA